MANRPSALWQHETFSRAQELESLLRYITARLGATGDLNHEQDALKRSIEDDLEQARSAATWKNPAGARVRNWISGGTLQSAEASLNAAEINLLRLAPLPYLDSNLQVLLADAKDLLPPDDARLSRLIQLAESSTEDGGFTEEERTTVVAAIEAAKKASLRGQFRLRSFRNVVLVAMMLASSLAIVLAIVGIFAPDTLPLCYSYADVQQQVCPASGEPGPADLLSSEFTGILGATVSAVFALRKVQGSADPYSISVALAVLKLPIGALTAFLGLLMISAGFVPGLTALDSSAQILAWAVVLGYSQEVFTSFVDKQAHAVLSDAHFGSGPQAPAHRQA